MKKIDDTKFEAAHTPTASTGSCQEQLNSRGEQLNNNSSQQLPDMLTHTPDANKGTSPDRQLAKGKVVWQLDRQTYYWTGGQTNRQIDR